MQPPHDDTRPYHLAVGDLASSDVLPAFRDPAFGGVHVRVDGELAEHPHAHELVSGLAEYLATRLTGHDASLYLEIDDEALRGGASMHTATRLASDQTAFVANAAIEHLQNWLSARGLAGRSAGDVTAEAAE